MSNPWFGKGNKFSIYPNPFKSNTTIEYRITNDADVSLVVYNVMRKINTL